jgi:hypothetical protein
MSIKRHRFLLLLMLIPSWIDPAQEKVPAKGILKVDKTVSGPFGGEKSASLIRDAIIIHIATERAYAKWVSLDACTCV